MQKSHLEKRDLVLQDVSHFWLLDMALENELECVK